jgi:hypothetical protein
MKNAKKALAYAYKQLEDGTACDGHTLDPAHSVKGRKKACWFLASPQRIIEEHRRVRASHGLVFPRVRTYEAIFRANVTAGAKLRGDVRRRRDRVFGVEYRESADGSDQDESANWE